MNLLILGSKGPDVTVWQNFLTSRGLQTKADGVFGPNTMSNTKEWQVRAGLPISGIVDEATLAKAQGFGFQIATQIDTKVVVTPTQSNLDLFDPKWSKITKINAAVLAKVAPVVAKRVLAFINEAASQGTILQAVQGLRTFSEQDALYAQGRSRPGKIVTNARGGQSLHNYGLAVDLAPVINGNIDWNDKDFRPYGGWAKDAGLDWGGAWKTFKDMPHVQDTDGMNLHRVQELYRQGGLGLVWSSVS